jgi:alpha-N-arabinofuranosidase
MVNVLQAMLQTDGPKMVKTASYWVFWMYRPFQGASALPVTVQSPDYVVGDVSQPAVDVIAARGEGGAIHVALVNIDPGRPPDLALALAGAGKAEGQVLTGPAMDTRNSFAAPDTLRPQPFAGAKWKGGKLTLRLPPKSLVVLRLAP